jgi:hypothetical protein
MEEKKKRKKRGHNDTRVISLSCGFESGGCTRYLVRNTLDSNLQKSKAIKCNQLSCSMPDVNSRSNFKYQLSSYSYFIGLI